MKKETGDREKGRGENLGRTAIPDFTLPMVSANLEENSAKFRISLAKSSRRKDMKRRVFPNTFTKGERRFVYNAAKRADRNGQETITIQVSKKDAVVCGVKLGKGSLFGVSSGVGMASRGSCRSIVVSTQDVIREF